MDSVPCAQERASRNDEAMDDSTRPPRYAVLEQPRPRQGASMLSTTIRPRAITIVLALLAGGSLLAALEPPSKPFLDKNSFYLTSAGFKPQFANDAAGKKALHALPPHRFVVHDNAGNPRYLYAEPQHCVCVFIGSSDAYE